MEYSVKLVFHIPCKAWDNGLIDVDYNTFKQILLENLSAIGLVNSYTVSATGHYKGREYDELLLTVFCENQYKDKAIEIFRQAFHKHNDFMQQEAFAYEHNDTLTVEEL